MMYELRFKELVWAIVFNKCGGQGWCMLSGGCERTAEGMAILKAFLVKWISSVGWTLRGRGMEYNKWQD